MERPVVRITGIGTSVRTNSQSHRGDVIGMSAATTGTTGKNATIRARALFASSLRPCNPLEPTQIRAAIEGTLAKLGVAGCLSAVAEEYGDYPEAAARRMRWALSVVGAA